MMHKPDFVYLLEILPRSLAPALAWSFIGVSGVAVSQDFGGTTACSGFQRLFATPHCRTVHNLCSCNT